ncbi:MAG TPA: DNA recombination protein RmuC, partial [Chryseobacterium sp.]
MEITYLIIGCFAGGIVGAVIIYFVLKSTMISRNSYDEINNSHIKSNADLENSNNKIRELDQIIRDEKELYLQQTNLLNDLKNEFS